MSTIPHHRNTQSTTAKNHPPNLLYLPRLSWKKVPKCATTMELVSSHHCCQGSLLNCSLVACPDDYTAQVYVGVEDNTKFCQCAHGTPYLLSCPPGLNFNGTSYNCDYPETVAPEEYYWSPWIELITSIDIDSTYKIKLLCITQLYLFIKCFVHRGSQD